MIRFKLDYVHTTSYVNIKIYIIRFNVHTAIRGAFFSLFKNRIISIRLLYIERDGELVYSNFMLYKTQQLRTSIIPSQILQQSNRKERY